MLARSSVSVKNISTVSRDNLSAQLNSRQGYGKERNRIDGTMRMRRKGDMIMW
jgi:hypothetical protein